MKPARHDFSRRAATPDLGGAAVTMAASRAPWASRATSRQVSVTAASAISPAGFTSGRSAKACQVAWPVRADRTPPSIAITLTSAPGHAAGTVHGRTGPAYARPRHGLNALASSARVHARAVRSLCPPRDLRPAEWKAGACSLAGQSGSLLSSGSRVRILPGAPGQSHIPILLD